MKLTRILLISTIPFIMLSTGCSVSVNESEPPKVKAPAEGSIMPDFPEPVTTCYGNHNTAIELTLEGNKALGFYAEMNTSGEMAGHGAYGSLNGERKNRRIDMENIYEVEGSLQREDVAFLLNRDGTLSQGSGELVDKGSKAVFKDPSKLTWGKKLKEISCSGNKLLDTARQLEKERRAKVQHM